MMGVYYTSPENSAQKHLFWLVGTHLSHSQNMLQRRPTIGFQRLPGRNT
jgi:hypothetical protein